MSLSFTVPLVPPSLNHYVRHTMKGRRYVTAEAEAFKAAVAIHLNGRFLRGKRFYCSLRIVLGKKGRGDVDNFPKLVLDGLAEAGAFCDLKDKPLSDAHVRRLLVDVDEDERPEVGRTEIVLEVLNAK